jgi:endonuclease/exonuclease/phosphatase family metal-dependent hydrolase
MRGRASFALTAAVLLFLLHSLAVLVATLFATTHAALDPVFRPWLLLPLLLPLLALLAPLLTLERIVDRHDAIAGAAAVCAIARIILCLPWHATRLVAASVVLAAGAIFLKSAVGYIERRRIAGALATAVTLDQLLRLAGWSWDITMRSWWLAPQLVISAFVIMLALAWRSLPAAIGTDRRGILERRAGGLRLRGGVALALLLFLDMHVLARPEVAAYWPGVRHELAAVVLIAAGASATLLLLAGHGPIGSGRRAAALLAVITGGAAVLAPVVPGIAGLLLMGAGHASALLLTGRALVPAGGRRAGRTVSIALATWFLWTAVYCFSFFPSFTIPALLDRSQWILGFAALLLLAVLTLLPRSLGSGPPLRGRLVMAVTLVLVLATASTLALRQRALPLVASAGSSLRVATWNVHHGFAEDWRFDPGRIAEEIERADPDLLALQEVGAGMPTAYGIDLPFYLSRRLRMPVRFGATHNGLMGDALLHRVRVEDAGSERLPTAGADARQLMRFTVALGDRPVLVLATRLGLGDAEQALQAAALTRAVAAAVAAGQPAIIVMGDLNAEPDGPTIAALRRAGLVDAFALARVPPAPTAPAARPTRRIDWIMVRDLVVDSAAVADGGGSDHRMVLARVRVR